MHVAASVHVLQQHSILSPLSADQPKHSNSLDIGGPQKLSSRDDVTARRSPSYAKLTPAGSCRNDILLTFHLHLSEKDFSTGYTLPSFVATSLVTPLPPHRYSVLHVRYNDYRGFSKQRSNRPTRTPP